MFSVFGLSRFKNEEYALCKACLGYHALRTKNIHCVSRVWALMFLERRIYTIFSVFGPSRSNNEEYTLC